MKSLASNIKNMSFFKSIKENHVYYHNVIFSVLVLVIAEAYITRFFDYVYELCIVDLNRVALGCLIIVCNIIYSINIIVQHLKKKRYISHLYFSWWCIFIFYYLYFRFFSNHYDFWSFQIKDCMIVYLDSCLLSYFVLLCTKCILCKKNNSSRLDSIILNDDPIGPDSVDLFDYNDLAQYLLEDLVSVNVEEHSFSVGIIGTWGAGKSSFLNLACDKIEKNKDIVVRFYPRNSYHLESIQDDFFKTFSEVISEYHTGLSGFIEKYIRALRILGNDNVLDRVANMFMNINTEDEKEKINSAIRRIGKKIYVVIEDLDRLSGKEILEVLKLIDRNGDFCNVFYLSAYDKQYVNEVLQNELGYDATQRYTDKYFCYEISLPVQKYWMIKDYVSQYLGKIKEDIGIIDYQNKILDAWVENGNIIISSLGTIRNVKRYLNLFMSRLIHVIDDVDVRDFLFLTLIRYKNIAIYDAIVKCQIVTKGNNLLQDDNTMFLSSGADSKIKDLGGDNEMMMLVQKLFPSPNNEYSDDNEYRKIRRAESFDIYFYERYRYRIYHKNMEPLFELKEDLSALELLTSLLSEKNNWNTVREYLYYHSSAEWLCKEEKLKRYIKLIILAYDLTQYRFYASKLKSLLYKSNAEEFTNKKVVKDITSYSDILYKSMDEMVERCDSSLGLWIVNLLDEFQKHADIPDDLVFDNQQYTNLAMGCLKTYTENKDTEWNPIISIELSAFASPSESKIFSEAKEYMISQLNKYPAEFASKLIIPSEHEQDGVKKLYLSLWEPNVLRYTLGDLHAFFDEWVKKLPSGSIRYTFNEILEDSDFTIIVNALKNHYELNDFEAYKDAIVNHKKNLRSLKNA